MPTLELQFRRVQRSFQSTCVIVTRHAAQRMAERQVEDELLLRIIDDGNQRWSDDRRLWAWLDVPGRPDNLLCAVLVLENAVIVKTLMHHWELLP